MEFKGNIEEIIKELFDISFFCNDIAEDDKKQQEADKKVYENEYEKLKNHYVNLSFIKAFNLFKSILHLSELNYPDEARILLRSLFELCVTFKYVFLGDKKEQCNILERYFDYIELVAPYHYLYKVINNDCKSQKFIEENQELCNFLSKQYKEYGVENKIREFKSNYNTNQLNYWYGDNFNNILNNVDLNINFKKIYYWYNFFTHNVPMNYYNGNEYSDKHFQENLIEILFVLNTLFSFFLVKYYPLRSFNTDLLQKSYLKPFKELTDKYRIRI